MRLGFTGSRHGMTDLQRQSFANLILQIQPVEFHHGSCQGADVQAAKIVRDLFPECWIVSHPGPDDDPHQRCSGVDNVKLPGRTHFARNRDIVGATDALVGTPYDDERQGRGGTWYTLDYGQAARKNPVVIWPDGRRSILAVIAPVASSPR